MERILEDSYMENIMKESRKGGFIDILWCIFLLDHE